MEIVAYAMSIVSAYLFLRLLQETIARKNAVDDLKRANQTIANMMGDISIVRMERQGVIEELEKVTKERDELQAKACKQKTNDIELLNLKIYKENVLARLKSIIDDGVDE